MRKGEDRAPTQVTFRGIVGNITLSRVGELPAVKISVVTPQGKSSEFHVLNPPDWLGVGISVEGEFHEAVTTRGVRNVVDNIRRASEQGEIELAEVTVMNVTFSTTSAIVEGVTPDQRTFSKTIDDRELISELKRGVKKVYGAFQVTGQVRRLVALLPYGRVRFAQRVKQLFSMIEGFETRGSPEELIRDKSGSEG
ncbi:MAG: hypothetical protein NZ957_05960 [Thaumarchaeota archaeon]|nr:hypothetical protein [Candidatus Calditenuaceae archaeon]MDW8042058.1 hypothetical protein [Nitrososphaerota archaeon]